MQPPPNCSPVHPVLANSTNVDKGRSAFFSAPPRPLKTKRPSVADLKDDSRRKRVKLSFPEPDVSEEEQTDESDVEMEDLADFNPPVVTTQSVFQMTQRRATLRPGLSSRPFHLPTRPILQSFVSSHKSDIFKCQSLDDGAFLTPPYACAYTHAAKMGGMPLLAVATEQGTVHMLNTSKRDEWDYELPRTVLQVHDNGIFDVQWSPTDAFFATTSGDQSVCVVDVTAKKVLHVLRGHTSTVKCVVWDPANTSLLSTGGRDGGICIWDLRVADQSIGLQPIVTIVGAHGEDAPAKGRGRRPKPNTAGRSVTSLLYPEGDPYGLISSGTFHGILRYWDLRQPTGNRKGKAKQPKAITQPAHRSEFDPTMLNGSRPRGITSLVAGSGPTAGLIFGLGIDSRIHTYASSSLSPIANGGTGTFSHPQMQVNNFYVRLALSPDGCHLASGSAGPRGAAFLYDVSDAGRTFSSADTRGVELRSQHGEVGALDWADGTLATCADDGTVRIWRQDLKKKRECEADEETAAWHYAWATDGAGLS
ncbi:hypothetical protein EWM64_g5376 [Hericium alpestre]|uniref:Uncharacterized protein n=1 Tax=Hericium alpestre TaxID=135208 RepID=A0A4Y9ZUS4_9AGAM|nr:hypothetical protein EWM64_g5376 [Hericium alpestre]